MDQLDAQTAFAVPVLWLAAAQVRPSAAAAQSRSIQDQQTQEPRGPTAVVSGGGLLARSAGQLPGVAGLEHAGWPRDVLVRRRRGQLRRRAVQSRRADFRRR